MLQCEVFPCQFAACFWGPYHWMVSKGLLSIHHRLQIHCIVNVNICIKGPDNKTIASPGRYKYLHNYDKKFMLNFWKRKKGKKINTILQQSIIFIE